MAAEKIVPETTDYAARARALMNQTVRAGALVIMPIGLAVQAHAAVILPTSTTTCSFGGSSCTPVANPLTEQNGLEGISLAGGQDEVGAGSSGGSGESIGLSLNSSGLLELDANGSTCNGVDQPCQLNSFQISFSAYMQPTSGEFGQALQSSITSFDGAAVFVSLDGNLLFSEFVAANPNSFEDSISGSATVAIPAEFQGDVANLVAGASGGSVDLAVGFSFQYSTDVPGGSLVDGSGSFSITGSDVALPEPGTTGLALSGLLGLGAFLGLGKWLRRRRA